MIALFFGRCGYGEGLYSLPVPQIYAYPDETDLATDAAMTNGRLYHSTNSGV